MFSIAFDSLCEVGLQDNCQLKRKTATNGAEHKPGVEASGTRRCVRALSHRSFPSQFLAMKSLWRATHLPLGPRDQGLFYPFPENPDAPAENSV